MRVKITISKSGSIADLAHELKHGYQFLMGEIDFRVTSGSSGALYDLTDEVAAFKRNYAFDPSSVQVGTISDITTGFVRDMTSGDGSMVYANLPSMNLTTNSTIGELRQSRKNGFLNNVPQEMTNMKYKDVKSTVFSNYISSNK